MEGISPFQSGRPLLSEITADKLNRILAEIKRNRPVVSAPLSARVTGDGTHISLGKLPSSGGSVAAPQPWDIYTTQFENDVYTLKVRPGTLGGILPSNWDAEFTANKDELVYGKVVVTTDGRDISSVSIVIDAQAPLQQTPLAYQTPASVEYLFGLWLNRNYRVASQGNIPFQPRVYMTLEKASTPAPGQSPYDLYYHLAL
jgi:hypothetical protein